MEIKFSNRTLGLDHPFDYLNCYVKGFLISNVSRMTKPSCISSE
jgi:hypothetical protein